MHQTELAVSFGKTPGLDESSLIGRAEICLDVSFVTGCFCIAIGKMHVAAEPRATQGCARWRGGGVEGWRAWMMRIVVTERSKSVPAKAKLN